MKHVVTNKLVILQHSHRGGTSVRAELTTWGACTRDMDAYVRGGYGSSG